MYISEIFLLPHIPLPNKAQSPPPAPDEPSSQQHNNTLPPQYNRPHSQTTPIHMRRIRILIRQKKTKRKHNNLIPHPKRIQQYPPNPRNMKRPLNQFVGMPALLVHTSCMSHRPRRAPMPEQHRFRQNIRRIQRRNTYRKNSVERRRGADIYQPNHAACQRHHYNRIQWYLRFGLDARHRLPEGQTLVSTNREYDP